MKETKQENAGQARKRCLQTKAFVKDRLRDYLDFVAGRLNDEKFVKAMDALQQSYDSTSDSLYIWDRDVSVREMGMTVERVDFLDQDGYDDFQDTEPATFLLGITIEIEESECNKPYYGLLLLTCALTLEELRAHVRTDKFANDVAESFERMIGDCYLIPDDKSQQDTP